MFFATLFWREPDLQIYNRAQCFQQTNIARNHSNIDIILILEKPCISLLPSNYHQGKRARGLAR